MSKLIAIVGGFLILVSTGRAISQVFDSGSDGSDGALVAPSGQTVIDLSLAAALPPGNGDGYYDPDLWAVVFNYTTIDIQPGATVTFLNHPSGAPVFWLASGDVNISGNVFLDGEAGLTGGGFFPPTATASGGPGGFPGGFGGVMFVTATFFPTGGYGPGGSSIDTDGNGNGSGGSYGSPGVLGSGSQNVVIGPTYGNIFVVPLIGGSGGAGGWSGSQFGDTGGGGGGAIVIASSGTVTLTGAITARGGTSVPVVGPGGGGSGGGIRLVANQLVGTGQLLATGGAGFPGNLGGGGAGRVRVEGNFIALDQPSNPPFTTGTPGLVFPPLNAPTLKATTLAATPVPVDPPLDPLSADVTINTDQPVTIQIEATNVPIGTTVDIRVVPKHAGNSFTVTSTPLAGTLAFSTATADVTFASGLSEVQLRAMWIPLGSARGPRAAGAKGRHFVKTKKSDPMRKDATLPRYRRIHAIVGVETGPGPNHTTYITGDGRRVIYPSGLFKGAGRLLSAAKAHVARAAGVGRK